MEHNPYGEIERPATTSMEALLAKRAPVRPVTKKTTGGINSPFNNAVALVIELMSDTKRPFAYWCGKLRNIPAQEIHAMMSKAKAGRNPRSLFNYLLKEYRTKQKAAK